MIDHLIPFSGPVDLSFITDGDGAPVQPPGLFAPPVAGKVQDAVCVLIQVRLVSQDAVTDPSTGETVTPADYEPGTWFIVRANAALTLPVSPAAITDSGCAEAGEAFVLHLDPSYGWPLLQKRLEPRFNGDCYPAGTEVGPEKMVV